MDFLPPALQPLGAWSQFVVWIAVPHAEKPGKFEKFPVDWQTGNVINAHDRQFWTSAACALAMAPRYDRGHGAGAGFVFTAEDPFFFHDIDSAWDGHQWSPLAQQLCARLAGCAVEVSHSGRGLHIFGRTAPIDHGKKNTALGLELYTAGRFVALTGTGAQGSVEFDATAPLAAIVAEFFPPKFGGEWGAGWTTEAVAGFTGPTDDDDLIRKALASGQRNAAAAFGNGSGAITFADLWEARADVLAARWPGEGAKPFGQSEADQALANMLAFWTGKNCERMERLMRRSGLLRDKWDSPSHRNYLGDTILNACAFVQQVYTQTSAPAPVVPPPSPEVMIAAAQATGRKLRDATREYMGPHDQLTYFDGCFYDNTTEKIYSLAKNTVFSKSGFDVNYGGHMFVLDPSSQKTTDSAWEAFTRSRVNEPVIVDGLCFRPELPGGALVIDGNRAYANAYVPHKPKMVDGDPGRILAHMAKLLPVEEDRKIFLSYLASMAQNPGRKFQWWPVLQGVEGNGKTIAISIMTHIMGQEYTHLPNAAAMARDGNKFNGWIYRKLFIGIEEICLSSRRDFLDEFKVVVTNERIPLEKKGQDQFTGDNRVNGILCTNHKDGVPVTVDSRRYAIFYTAQQRPEDLERDGMTSTYFADLWDWLKGRGAYASLGEDYGFAVAAGYFKTLAVEEAYDPAKLSQRAPKTSSTAEAVQASLGRVEQEVLDAIDEGRTGFAGGWVSSFYLDQLIDQLRAFVPRNKRRAMMQSLGYDYHPALKEGRTNDHVMPDNRKPRLYVKHGHLALNVDQPAEVARLYTKAQEPGSVATVSPAALAFAPRPA